MSKELSHIGILNIILQEKLCGNSIFKYELNIDELIDNFIYDTITGLIEKYYTLHNNIKLILNINKNINFYLYIDIDKIYSENNIGINACFGEKSKEHTTKNEETCTNTINKNWYRDRYAIESWLPDDKTLSIADFYILLLNTIYNYMMISKSKSIILTKYIHFDNSNYHNIEIKFSSKLFNELKCKLNTTVQPKLHEDINYAFMEIEAKNGSKTIHPKLFENGVGVVCDCISKLRNPEDKYEHKKIKNAHIYLCNNEIWLIDVIKQLDNDAIHYITSMYILGEYNHTIMIRHKDGWICNRSCCDINYFKVKDIMLN